MISPTFNNEHVRGAEGQPAPPLITTRRSKTKWVSLISSLITRGVFDHDRGALDSTMHLIDVDLLDHTGLEPGCGFQSMAAPGTKIDSTIERPAVDGLERERIALVFRVSRLATDLALNLTIGRRRFRRLDDVRGRRLGRGRGILPRRRELLLVFSNSGLKRSEPRRQSPTIWTRLPCLGFHASLC